MSNDENDALGDGHHSFTKDVLDQKALNCVEFALMQALCVWDGGHLATQAEIQTAWQAGEGRVYPWGGTSFNIPGFMVWMAVLYCIAGSVAANKTADGTTQAQVTPGTLGNLVAMELSMMSWAASDGRSG